MIFPDTVSISRNQKTGITAVNESQFSLVVINTSQKCDIQPRKGVLVMAGSGQTNIMYKTVFMPVIDVKAGDVLTDLNANIEYKVTNINQYSLLKHLEVDAESGVV